MSGDFEEGSFLGLPRGEGAADVARYFMLLMGEEGADNRSSLGLLHSNDGIHWEIIPEGS